jgi:exodeoxyribonuclease VII small subunit
MTDLINLDDKKYSEIIQEVESILQKLQKCEDVDDAMQLFNDATEQLKICETRLANAKGTFEKITGK